MNKKAISRSVLFLAAACFSVSSIHASVLVGSPGDPGVGDCAPFGCPDDATYQQLYLSTLFPGPITISGVTFFDQNFDNTGFGLIPTIYPANYTITFSIIPASVLDPTVANNLNPDPAQTQLFFSGPLGDGITPVVDQFTIFQNAGNFVYDPSQGNLVMQVTNDGSSGPLFDMFMDIDQNYSSFAVAFDSNPHPGVADCNLSGANGPYSGGDTQGCMQANYGLVTQFETVSGSTAPEPAGGVLTFCALLSACLYRIRKKARP